MSSDDDCFRFGARRAACGITGAPAAGGLSFGQASLFGVFCPNFLAATGKNRLEIGQTPKNKVICPNKNRQNRGNRLDTTRMNRRPDQKTA